jgi:glutamate synthase (NADPH/NADH) large chain
MHYTNSKRAKSIIDNWENFLPKFVKVMPVDYRRALQEMQARTSETGQLDIGVAVGD